MIILGPSGCYDRWMAIADRIARADRRDIPVYHKLCRLAWKVAIGRACRG